MSLSCLPAPAKPGTEDDPALKTYLGVSQLLWRRTRYSFCASLQDSPHWRAIASLCGGC